jgi:hypothetical protein
MNDKDTVPTFMERCFACRQVMREDAWPSFLRGLTFGAVNIRRTEEQRWARHQEIFLAGGAASATSAPKKGTP